MMESPGLVERHEAVEIGQGPRADADFGISGLEDFGGEFGADHLDFLDRLQPHFVLVAGIAERRAGAETTGKRGLRAWGS